MSNEVSDIQMTRGAREENRWRRQWAQAVVETRSCLKLTTSVSAPRKYSAAASSDPCSLYTRALSSNSAWT